MTNQYGPRIVLSFGMSRDRKMEMQQRLTPPIAGTLAEAAEHGKKMSAVRKPAINEENVTRVVDYLSGGNSGLVRKIRSYMRRVYDAQVSTEEISAARILIE
jgi:hypothetical protein